VIQIVALLVALTPATPPAVAGGGAAASLVLLTWSFVVDVVWLRRPAAR
jgi:hypothetical protein